ncbi:MAG TPA: hypothetical protein PKD53_01465 [Chloroflexaceae bacterium]|nr:hypothetical protein [Chloroflexaceae bacterium]
MITVWTSATSRLRRVQAPWLSTALQTCFFSSFGLLYLAVGNTLSRFDEPYAEVSFWAGLIVLFTPFVIRLLSPSLVRQERIFLICALAMWTYIVKILHSPEYFTFTDEILHYRSTENILRTGLLFGYNPLLPVSAYYPGFQNIFVSLIQLGDLPLFPVGILVVGLSRILFAAALYLFYEQASESSYVGGVASVIYAANPFFLFHTFQAAYASVALSLAAFVLAWLLRSQHYGVSPGARRLVLILACVSIVVTHHLTSYMLAIFLCIWLVMSISLKATRQASGIGPFAPLLLVALAAGWTLAVAQITVDYMVPQGRAVLQEIWGIATGQTEPRKLFQASTGSVAPPLEQFTAYVSVLLLLAGLGLGLIQVWQRHRANPLILALAVVASAYPVSLGLRVTRLHYITTRASEYVFMGLALIIALGVAALLLSPGRVAWHQRGVSLMALTAILGGIILGWGPASRQPGPYLVAAEVRSIEPLSIAVAEWTEEHLGVQRFVVADRSNAILLSAYGYQNPVDTVNSTLAIPMVYFAPVFGPGERALLCEGKVSHIVVDHRLSSDLPMSGTYFWPDEPNAFRHERPIDPRSLEKFDREQDLNRILDTGDIVIYDTYRVRCDQ